MAESPDATVARVEGLATGEVAPVIGWFDDYLERTLHVVVDTEISSVAHVQAGVDAVGRLSNPSTPVDRGVESAAVVRQKQTRLKRDQVNRLVELYQSGTRVGELAGLFEISRTTVWAHLRRAGESE